jgi:BirA family biotin operon repressor/biotin-[acetyl-CoA-carboxylase] ligase
MNIIRVATAASTNRLLQEWIETRKLTPPTEGTLLTAETQTAGRGQEGTHWEAEPKKNITASLLLYPTFLPLTQAFLLSEAIALGVKETLDDAAAPLPAPFTIKWPNDIYCENKKIAGILIENNLTTQQIDRSIIGIGLNVNQETFTSDAPNPTSLKRLLGTTLPLDKLTNQLHRNLMQWYQILKEKQFEKITTAYHSALYRRSGFHPYRDRQGLFTAQIQSVSHDGHLHLITDQGEKRKYAFKEVAFVTEAEINRN